MAEDTTQLVQQRFAELPGEVKAAIESNDLGNKVRTIGARHQLHIDQTGELEDEVMLAMLGFSELEDMAGRISTALRVPPEVAQKIAQEVSNEIFTPIRESLKKFTASKASPITTPTSVPAPLPA